MFHSFCDSFSFFYRFLYGFHFIFINIFDIVIDFPILFVIETVTKENCIVNLFTSEYHLKLGIDRSFFEKKKWKISGLMKEKDDSSDFKPFAHQIWKYIKLHTEIKYVSFILISNLASMLRIQIKKLLENRKNNKII